MSQLQEWVFCSIKVRARMWYGSPVLAVYIDDVTEDTKAKVQEIQGNEKKEQQRHAQNFKATVSHELRTPVKMCIDFLKDLI